MSNKRGLLLLSQAAQFRLKAAECLQMADVARQSETRTTLDKLARFYVRLAIRADCLKREAARSARH